MLSAIVLAAALAAADPGAGRLVIVGGGLQPDNAAVHEAFLADLPPEGRIAIIPAASGEPATSARAFARALSAYGVDAGRVEIVRLAVRDDPSTSENEAAWGDGAQRPEEIAKIARAAAIWFIGGDQARLTATLLRPDGADTPMLSAIRARLRAGATVGGTSAGAAVMSAAMIGGGSALGALLDDPHEAEMTPPDDRLILTRGLGFLPTGVVDQHFGERARLGRLVRAAAEQPPPERFGFGIDEDTALRVDLGARRGEVFGEGSVVVVDARAAAIAGTASRFGIREVQLSVLTEGDWIDLARLEPHPAPGKAQIQRGEEAETAPDPGGGGMASPAPPLEDLLGAGLLDNAAVDRIARVSFDAQGRGVRYVFREDAGSAAFHGDGRMMIRAVAFAIEPVVVSAEEAP